MGTWWGICAILVLGGAVEEANFLENVRTTEPLTATQQEATFHLPPGFQIDLVASEPDLQKPMNLAFDARGRLWVSGSVEYPYAAAQGKGRDAIRILEDRDADGEFDQVTTFAEGLNIPLGLYPYRDGVIAYSISQIEYFRDTDGDQRADQRQVLYGPLDPPADTHGMQNAFRRGLDGWLYINHGFANRTTIRGADGSELALHSGNTYRVRIDGTRVESHTWGQVNPFGSAWTDLGDLVTADCHSRPLTMLLRGAHYSSFGKPHDGLGFGPDLLEHSHGSTGLAGVVFCQDAFWPEPFRGDLLVGNVVTSRVHRDRLEYQGGTPRAVEEPDLITSDDPWFRPVDLAWGPDGALYIADFYNRIIGHYEVPLEHPGRDRARARIWRVFPAGTPRLRERLPPLDVQSAAALQGWLRELSSDNITRRYLATDVLSDTWGQASVEALRDLLAREGVNPSSDFPNTNVDAAQRERGRIHARWVLFRLGELSEGEAVRAMQASSLSERVHGLRMLAEWPRAWNSASRAQILNCLADPEPTVRRVAADTLSRQVDVSQVTPLLSALRDTPTTDTMLRHSLRIALRDHFREPTVARLSLADRHPSRGSDELAQILLAAPSPSASAYLLESLRDETLEANTFQTIATAVAPHLSSAQLAAFAALVRQRAPNDLPWQLTMWDVVRQSVSAGERAQHPVLRPWAHDVVQRFASERATWSTGWHESAVELSWGLETRTTSDGRTIPFLSSLVGGEQRRSRLESNKFVLSKVVEFELCGHRGNPATVVRPNTLPSLDEHPTNDTFVQLRRVADGKILRRAFPPRNDRAMHVNWDVAEFQGQEAQIEVVDDLADAAYAWLAVSDFSQSELMLPQIDPRSRSQHMRAVCELIRSLVMIEWESDVRDWFERAPDGASRAAAARALLTLRRLEIWQPFVELYQLEGLDANLVSELQQCVLHGAAPEWHVLAPRVFRAVPRAVQESLARALAVQIETAELLLSAMEQGHVSGLLLQRPAIRNALLALPLREGVARIDRVLATLPSEAETVDSLLSQIVQQQASTPGDPVRGREVFVKHCLACHQVQGHGNTIGPQLDGIGNRGLTRVVEDVIAPYRNVDLAFRSAVITLVDGRIVQGMVRDTSLPVWTVIDSQGKSQMLEKSQVEEHHLSATSVMPDNFATTLSQGEQLDLFAWLQGLRAAAPPSTSAP